MRVLVASFSVCPAPDRQGVQLGHLIKALAPRFEVDVVTLRVGDLAYVDRFHKARMLRVPVGGGGLVEQAEAFGRALRRQLEGEEYDIVHLRTAWGARASAKDQRLNGAIGISRPCLCTSTPIRTGSPSNWAVTFWVCRPRIRFESVVRY